MSETTTPDMDEIEQLLGELESTPPEQTTPEQIPITQEPSAPISPTLAALDESRRPSQEVVCGTCPNSVWFASPTEVKCYCRVMFLVTWSTTEPNDITQCDGMGMM
ncbi:conjugal transfer protein TraH [Vibrio parahaemolyticus]|nr:conjugal transfer protein TraH [Vibrio parahaemolyticus]